MKCRDVEDVLAASNARGTGNLMPSVRAHIEECKSCQEFARIVELPSADAHVDSSQIDRLAKMIVSDLRPVRPLLPNGYSSWPLHLFLWGSVVWVCCISDRTAGLS
jgi:hypothetical protein